MAEDRNALLVMTEEQREVEIRLASLRGRRHSWYGVWSEMMAEGMKEQDEASKREMIDKMVNPPGVVDPEPFDPKNYKTWISASPFVSQAAADGWRRDVEAQKVASGQGLATPQPERYISVEEAKAMFRQMAALKSDLERSEQTVELAVQVKQRLEYERDLAWAEIASLTVERNEAVERSERTLRMFHGEVEASREWTQRYREARADNVRLTEERDNARANAEHFAAMLNGRAAPNLAEPTPDGILAPIPRNTPLGNTLAALRGAKP